MSKPQRELSVVNKGHVDKLLASLSNRSNIGIRNRALIITLERSGLRIGELLALRIACFDFAAGTIRVPKTKSGRPHTCGVDEVVLAAVSRWMDRRRLLLRIDDRIPIFCATNGRPLSSSAVRELLKRLAKRAQVDAQIQPHGFRRGFIGRLAAAGIPLSVISQAANHADVLTTLVYLRRTGLGNEAVPVLRTFDWDNR